MLSLSAAVWGNTCPVWQGVDSNLHLLLHLMHRGSPLQVCISLIKTCLSASCLPFARFIINAVGWENKCYRGLKWPVFSVYQILWSSFYELKGAPAAVSAEHTAICLWRECSWSAHPGMLTCLCAPPLRTLLHTTKCIFHLFLLYASPQPTIALILPHTKSFAWFRPHLECLCSGKRYHHKPTLKIPII